MKIDLLGTNTSVTINNWFSSSADQLQEIVAGGLKIDKQGIAAESQAMASIQANNPGFNPTSSGVSTVPNDSNLQSALGAAWHS